MDALRFSSGFNLGLLRQRGQPHVNGSPLAVEAVGTRPEGARDVQTPRLGKRLQPPEGIGREIGRQDWRAAPQSRASRGVLRAGVSSSRGQLATREMIPPVGYTHGPGDEDE
jgi:hypothetical protein